MRLQDRVVFITGASRGIGRAVALACAREGAHIVVAAKSDQPDNPKLPGTIHDVVKEVEALGRKGLAIKLDVRDAEACEAAVKRTIEEIEHALRLLKLPKGERESLHSKAVQYANATVQYSEPGKTEMVSA